MTYSRTLKTVGIALLAVGVAAAIGTFVVRDQMARHRRNLFSKHALRRFAALGYVGGLTATVEMVQLLRDFVGWEPHRLLQRRAAAILERMEQQLQESGVRGDVVG